jgi:hypothetical protein
MTGVMGSIVNGRHRRKTHQKNQAGTREQQRERFENRNSGPGEDKG